MNIYSFTDSTYSKPNINFDDKWPVQFIEGFSKFYNNYHHNKVIIVEDPQSATYIPIRIFHVKQFRFGQILHAPVSNAEELNAVNQVEFLNKLIAFIKSKKIIHRLIQPHPFGIMLGVPNNAASCEFGTYITPLSGNDDETLLSLYDVKYKKAVQHSIKNGGRIEFGRKVFDDFYKMYTATTERAKIHRDSIEYFNELYATLGENHIETGVVYDEDRPIGAIFMIYTKYSALCTHAGSGGESKLYGGMKHLHYDMMKHLRDKGVKNYDLVGVRLNSSNESLQGVFRFKKGFGGVLKEGYLWKTDISPLPMKLYDLLVSIRQGKNVQKDIIDQETN